MSDNTALSFTATLLVNGHPLILLNQITDRAVMVPHPDSNLGQLDASQALGVLSAPDEAWDEARDAGLVDFHLTGDPSPAVFYFRHSDEGYRLYLRGGDHAGQGVFKSKYGLATSCTINDSDPTPWQLRLAHTEQPVVLSDLVTDFAIVTFECASTGVHLTTSTIGDGEGGYLITHKSAPPTQLRLNILEREVDWARR